MINSKLDLEVAAIMSWRGGGEGRFDAHEQIHQAEV